MDRIIIFGILAISGFLANIYPVHYVFDIGFICGNLFLFALARIYKFKYVAIAILIIYTGTFFIKGFSLISLLYMLEVLFVCYRNSKANKKEMLIEVLVFWAFFGAIYSWIYYYNIGMTAGQMTFSIINTFINSIINVFIGEMIGYYYLLYKKQKNGDKGTLSLEHVAFQIIMLTMITPFLITTILNGRQFEDTFKSRNYSQAQTLTKDIEKRINSWSKQDLQKFKLQGRIQIGHIEKVLEHYSFQEPFSILIKNDRDNVIMSTSKEMKEEIMNMKIEGKATQLRENFYYIQLRDAKKNNRFIQEVKGYYVYELPIIKKQLNIEVITPIDTYKESIMEEYVVCFQIMSIFSIFLFVAYWMFKRLLLRSIQELVDLTNDLPEQLNEQEKMLWPESNASEINLLIINIKNMYNKLNDMFEKRDKLNHTLKEQARMLEHSREELHKLAYYDILTGLANRLSFREYLGGIMKMEIDFKVAVMFIDLDKFKQINDILGHDTGDKLLIQVAKRLKKLESHFTKAFRLGGDEFVIIHHSYKERSIEEVSEKILDIFNQPFILKEKPFLITGSVGIGIYPDQGSNIEDIIKNADMAMYYSKNKGGQRICTFNKEIEESFMEEIISNKIEY